MSHGAGRESTDSQNLSTGLGGAGRWARDLTSNSGTSFSPEKYLISTDSCAPNHLRKITDEVIINDYRIGQ